ncbi:Mitogen-activated protein kinase kinase kinase kinase 3, partial [Nibea albiflora]
MSCCLDFSCRNLQEFFQLIQRVCSGMYRDAYEACTPVCVYTRSVFGMVQREILMMKDYKHSNIVAYYGSYLWSAGCSLPETEEEVLVVVNDGRFQQLKTHLAEPVASLGGVDSAVMALISLEDLDGLDDEQLDDDDITDNPEPMEDDDRLLSHWQAVASTHQVSVPPEMTGPIQEMTRNSQQREPLPFVPVSSHEKMGEVLYEERLYPAGNWACVTRGEDLYEQSISMAFMKLMRFICKENSAGRYLGMTVPVISNIHMKDDGITFKKNVLTAFFLPAEFQTNPPRPSDPDISIIHREPMRVIARTFLGTTTEETVTRQINLLWEILGVTDELHRDEYMVAVYENPGIPRRRN